MLRLNGSSRFHGFPVALVITTTAGVYGTACVAQEPSPAVVAAQTAASAAAQTEGSDPENKFPYPIWKNRVFDDANNLAGVLLRTTEGPVQIKKLKWFANEAGFINIGYIDGFNSDGEPVTFGSPDGCLEQVTKETFLGYAMTQSDTYIKSFDFVTDHEGYLAVGNPVIALQLLQDEDPCGIRTIRRCQSLGCNGSCGSPIDVLLLSSGGSGPAINPDNEPLLPYGTPEPIDCRCNGTEGTCQVVNEQTCSGTCLPGLSCGATDNEGEFGCQCR